MIFDLYGNGVVDIPDFLLFVDVFGSKEGEEKYDAKYDLDENGEIGIPDFLIFVDNFGKVVNRVPVFTVDSGGTTPVSSVTLSVDENTASGQPIGEPISATDGDDDTLIYRLSGADADNFAIDARTGQITTQGTYDFEQKSSYSVTVIVSDGKGGNASLEVNITINNIEEPSATVPSNVVVEEGDSKLTVRWDAVPDEEGKPTVTGYEVGYRERPDPFDPPQENSNEWASIQKVSSQLDILIITGLLNGQAYLVSVRTLVDGGMSEWSSPVLGIPVIPAAGPVFPGGGGSGGGGTPPPPPPPPPSPVVTIPDANLRAVIEDSLDKAPGAPITRDEMSTLTILQAPDASISDLTGLEFATRLTSLFLSNNSISNISSLSGLTNLEGLRLANNSISNISSLSGLTNLEGLDLSYNSISDIQSLSGLTNLEYLSLESNSISDISSLSGLTNLEYLSLGDNSISDISSLSDMTKLEYLYLDYNSISDISSLSGLTNLLDLILERNSISDLSSLSGLTKLVRLALARNSISNLSPVSGLTNLHDLSLHTNSISDISSLSGLTNLEDLYLSNNSISNLSPVSGLTNLEDLHIRNNSVSDLSPLVSNTGLGSGDLVDVRDNPLSATSLNTHVPTLQGRGITLRYE